MAYKWKYYKSIESQGHLWTVDIFQDTEESVVAKEIGPVLQGLRLIVQGDQADFDTPIVKTSLAMAFADAPDLNDSRKCGYWEEFYTSSATEYKVMLYKDDELQWTGYITPDSFSEELRYRGSVTIIARDNLGTLQDSTFDMSAEQNVDGKVMIKDLIEKAIELSTCALFYSYNEDLMPFAVGISDTKYEMSGNLLWQMIDIRAFEDATWWDALEKTLYSVGLVLRYTGTNRLRLMTLRDMPKSGMEQWSDVPMKYVSFCAYGHRELVPGVKGITEVHEFEASAESAPITIGSYENRSTFQSNNLTFYDQNGNITSSGITQVPAWGYSYMKIAIPAQNSRLLSVNDYPRVKGEDSEAYGAWDDKSIFYFACNEIPSESERPLNLLRKVYGAHKIKLHMVVDKPVTLLSDYSAVLNLPIKSLLTIYQQPYIAYRIRFIDSTTGTILFYDAASSKWVSSLVNNTANLDKSLFMNDFAANNTTINIELDATCAGTVNWEIVEVFCPLSAQLRYPCKGMYVRLRDVSIDVELPEDTSLLSKITLNTNYSNKYAVRLTRDTMLGVLPTELPIVANVPNAILTEGEYQYSGADKWIWQNGRSFAEFPKEGISLSRLIHQQLLAYHAKPNNLLTGELVTEDPTFDALYRWNGVDHLLLSGALNILTGRMENAVLREFKRYDNMWDD